MVAKEYYEKSLKISREVKDEMSESYALSAIGVIYEGMLNTKGNYEIALKYYLKSLEIRQRLGEQDELASSLNETAESLSRNFASASRRRGKSSCETGNKLNHIIGFGSLYPGNGLLPIVSPT